MPNAKNMREYNFSPELEGLEDGDLDSLSLEDNPFTTAAITDINVNGGINESIVKTLIHKFNPILLNSSTGISLISDDFASLILEDINGMTDDNDKRIRLLLYILCIDPSWQI